MGGTKGDVIGTYTAKEILNEMKEFTWNREVK